MANVRLVAHVAKRYHDRGIPPGDLIQEGFCALLVAIDRFDLVNEITAGDLRDLVDSPGDPACRGRGGLSRPVEPEAAPPTGPGPAITGTGASTGNERCVPTRRQPAVSPTIEQVFAATRPVLSLDAPSRLDDTTTIGEFLVPPDDEDSPAEDAQHSVGDLIKTLGPREQLILKLRFGLGGEAPLTLDRGEQGSGRVERAGTPDPGSSTQKAASFASRRRVSASTEPMPPRKHCREKRARWNAIETVR